MTTMSIGVKRDELLQDGNVALGERGIKKRVRLKSYSLSRDEPMTRFELVTSSLPRKRSTPELHRRKNERETGFEPATISLEG